MGFVFVGTWKLCVPLCPSGFWEERTPVRPSSLALSYGFLPESVFTQLLSHTRYHDLARCSEGLEDVDKQKLQNSLPSFLSARSDARCDILSQLYSSHDRGIRPLYHMCVILVKETRFHVCCFVQTLTRRVNALTPIFPRGTNYHSISQRVGDRSSQPRLSCARFFVS